MFRDSVCEICVISEICAGFWTTRRRQTTPGRSHFIIGPLVPGSSAFPKADADRTGALHALADFADGLRVSRLRSHRATRRLFFSSGISATILYREAGPGFAVTGRRPFTAKTRRREGDAGMIMQSLCEICAISEICAGFWATH